jgi:hypothetical protein
MNSKNHSVLSVLIAKSSISLLGSASMSFVAKALANIFRPLAKMNSLLAHESEALGGDVLVAAS